MLVAKSQIHSADSIQSENIICIIFGANFRTHIASICHVFPSNMHISEFVVINTTLKSGSV